MDTIQKFVLCSLAASLVAFMPATANAQLVAENGSIACVSACTAHIQASLGRHACVTADDYLQCLQSKPECSEMAKNEIAALQAACNACAGRSTFCGNQEPAKVSAPKRAKSARTPKKTKVKAAAPPAETKGETPEPLPVTDECKRLGGVYIEQFTTDAKGVTRKTRHCFTLKAAYKKLAALEDRVTKLEAGTTDTGGETPPVEVDSAYDKLNEEFVAAVTRFSKVEAGLEILCESVPEEYRSDSTELAEKCRDYAKYVDSIDTRSKENAKTIGDNTEKIGEIDGRVETLEQAPPQADAPAMPAPGSGHNYRCNRVRGAAAAGAYLFKLPKTDESLLYGGLEGQFALCLEENVFVDVLGGFGGTGDVNDHGRLTFWGGGGMLYAPSESVMLGADAIGSMFLRSDEASTLNIYTIAPVVHWFPKLGTMKEDDRWSLAASFRLPVGIRNFSVEGRERQDLALGAQLSLGVAY